MQTSPLNIWGLPLADATQSIKNAPEAGFEGILDQVVPPSEALTDAILGETGLEAGSTGPIALDQELDQATESQTSSDLIAMVMSGCAVPKAQETGEAGQISFAVISAPSDSSEIALGPLEAKKEARTTAPLRQAAAEEVAAFVTPGEMALPEGFDVLDQPVGFEAETQSQPSTSLTSGGQVASASTPLPSGSSADSTPEVEAQDSIDPSRTPDTRTESTKPESLQASAGQPTNEAGKSLEAPSSAVEAALPEETLPFVKSGDPIGQLLNERWQAWVKQNYVGPMAAQNTAPLMPAAMNTAFTAAAHSGQITLSQAEVKPVVAATPIYTAAVTAVEESIEGEGVEAPAPVQANPNLGGVFGSAVRTVVKPAFGQNEAFAQADTTLFEDEFSEAMEAESGSIEQSLELPTDSLQVQSKDQVPAQSRPLNLEEEKAVVKQASKTLQDMIEANRPKTMTIRLNPDDLGSLTIKVRQFGRRVEAEVSASLDSVRHALNSQKQELAAAVENRGAQLTNFVIKSEPVVTDSHTNSSLGQQANSGDGRSHQESQLEADRLARLAASHTASSENQSVRVPTRISRTTQFDLRA